jgi:hypothetical protein
MLPTPYSDLNKVLSALVSRIRAILENEFLGAYLQGSFAIGDFDLDSDVDFIVAIKDEISRHQVDALQRMHNQIYQLESKWAQHLEGSYFPKELLRRQSDHDLQLWYLDNGARSLIRSNHCNTLVVRWTVREKGVTLAGPSPNVLVDPISKKQLRGEIYETITNWGQEIINGPAPFNDRFYQGFIVLNYCRMLHDLRTGKIGSKREGADWAKNALDPSWSDLIDRAWTNRPNPAQKVRQPADPQDFDRTLRFVEYIMNESRSDRSNFELNIP